MKTILTICLLIGSTILQSQTIDNDKAHRRYWYYRTRMINDFMKIGKEQGDCLVFAERNIGEDNLNNSTQPELESTIGPDQIDITNQYMMALALEYKILSRNNQSTEETIKELYHLLYTLNRLDLEAEQFFDSSPPTNDHIQASGLLNGFILREDMPSDYFTANNNENFVHYNYELLEHNYPQQPNVLESYNGFTGIQHTNAQSADSKFKKYFTGVVGKDEITLVQEKYQSLLIALMFITKYIPNNTYYKPNGTIEAFQDNVNGIKEQAREIAKRCYTYLKNPNGYWSLKLVNSAGISSGSPSVGASAYVYAWSLSREACMANRDFPWNQTFANQQFCNNFNDTYATTVGFALYNTMSQLAIPGYNDVFVTLAYSHAGSDTDPSLSGGTTPTPIAQAMQINTSAKNLQWAEILRKVLHQDEVLFRQLNDYATPINVAPCQGPYNYGHCENGGWEWSSQDRDEHQGARGAGCPGYATGVYGNYPGVDYMLAHNLYYEYQNQLLDGNQGNNSNSPSYNILSWIYNVTSGVWQSVYGNGGSGSSYNLVGYNEAFNYMDNLDASIWPTQYTSLGGGVFGGGGATSTTLGTTSKPAKVAVFQNLKSTAHIYFKHSPAAPSNNIPSDVTYRAGKEISILPGFQVDAGSTFHAYILRYVCTDNADALGMRHIQDSATLANAHIMDYESDEMNPIPMHYIESPKSDADKTPVVPINSEDDNSLPLIADGIVHPASEFTMQPNPSTGIFKVFTQKEIDNETLSIHIYDMRGQLINSYADVTPEFEINLSGYSKGIYMVQLMSTTGKVSSKRVDIIE